MGNFEVFLINHTACTLPADWKSLQDIESPFWRNGDSASHRGVGGQIESNEEEEEKKEKEGVATYILSESFHLLSPPPTAYPRTLAWISLCRRLVVDKNNANHSPLQSPIQKAIASRKSTLLMSTVAHLEPISVDVLCRLAFEGASLPIRFLVVAFVWSIVNQFTSHIRTALSAHGLQIAMWRSRLAPCLYFRVMDSNRE